MAYDWNQFGEFSFWLLSKKHNQPNISKETFIRNAISRLFYNAYHCVRIWSEKKYNFNRKTDRSTHLQLIEFLISKKEAELSYQYKTLRNIRNKADYHDVVKNLDSLLKQSKDLHKKIINKIAFHN